MPQYVATSTIARQLSGGSQSQRRDGEILIGSLPSMQGSNVWGRSSPVRHRTVNK
jgi:hypothetical protein